MARPRGTQELIGSSIRLPVRIDKLWEAVAAQMGLNKTAVLILAINELADRKGVSVPQETEEVTA